MTYTYTYRYTQAEVVIYINMYRGGGGGGSLKGGGEIFDRKRIIDALDKHLEKSSPSTSKKPPAAAAGKQHNHLDHRDTRSSSTGNKNRGPDGISSFFFSVYFLGLVYILLLFNNLLKEMEGMVLVGSCGFRFSLWRYSFLCVNSVCFFFFFS